MSLAVAVVGAGPAGFYCAEALAKLAPGARIDILDRLPTPFGLVRAGVAPDHQGTKNIVRVFGRTAEKAGVRFIGNVCIGSDISMAELSATYDAVVLAFGAPKDRRLGIPGEALAGVFGSAAFVGWYNGHPDFRDLPVRLEGVRSVAVIGNGNVAIDVVRVLAKTPAEMAKSDIAAHAAERIHTAPLAAIHLIGRRGPVDASFTNVELAELGRMERGLPLVDASDLPDDIGEVPEPLRRVREANLATLRGFSANSPGDKPLPLRFHFHTVPEAFIGEGGELRAVRLRRPSGEVFDVPADLAVTCIGYRSVPLEGIPFDEATGVVPNQGGRVGRGLYVVGWAGRGPSGTIATNRADSIAVAERLLADIGDTAGRPGPAALDRLLMERGLHPIAFADWQKIDAEECARAAGGPAPRLKFTSIEEMLALLR